MNVYFIAWNVSFSNLAPSIFLPGNAVPKRRAAQLAGPPAGAGESAAPAGHRAGDALAAHTTAPRHLPHHWAPAGRHRGLEPRQQRPLGPRQHLPQSALYPGF